MVIEESFVHVIAATDMPGRNPLVVQGAADFADAVGSTTLTVLHVVSEGRLQTMEEERPEEFRFIDVVLDEIRADVDRETREAIGDRALALDVQVLRGEPGATVIDWIARNSPDYAIIGVRNRSRVGKFVFGSTAQAILLGSTVPVLAVPAES